MRNRFTDDYRLTVAYNVIALIAHAAGLNDHPDVSHALDFVSGATDEDPLPFPKTEPLFPQERLIPAAPAMYDALCMFTGSVMERTDNGNVYALGELHQAEKAARAALAIVEGA